MNAYEDKQEKQHSTLKSALLVMADNTHTHTFTGCFEEYQNNNASFITRTSSGL